MRLLKRIEPQVRLARSVERLARRTVVDAQAAFEHDPLAAEALAAGFLARSCRLLIATRRLYTAGQSDASDSIARSAFELVATAFWLLESPTANGELFVRASLRDMRLLEAMGAFTSRATLTAEVTSRFGDASEARLPPLDQRLNPVMQSRYAVYRMLSQRAHPTVASAGIALEEPTHGRHPVDIVTVDGESESGYVPYVAILVWGLTGFVRNAAGFPPSGSWARLGEKLNSFGQSGHRSAHFLK